MAFGVTWYLHVPVPNWIGSRNAEAVTVTAVGAGAAAPAAAAHGADAIFADAEEAFRGWPLDRGG